MVPAREPSISSRPHIEAARYSQSLERGLAILSSFTPRRPVLGVADIARELGMSRSTTHRYVSTLLVLGCLEQDRSREYRLGLRVTNLGMSSLSATELREHAHEYLEELARHASHTASLGVLDGTDVLFVDRVQSLRREHEVGEVELSVGSRLPAHCTAVGKLLLAHLPTSLRRELVQSMQLDSGGPNAITSQAELESELDAIANADFAVSDEELASGLYAIAAPVRDDAGEVRAAVSLAAAGSTISLEGLVDGLGSHLISTAHRISARLGYRRADEDR
jgi:IclR family pca regulon transcriptional regulator